jgi:hypothetical protein
MSAKLAIVVVYEGAAARDPAMQFCDDLVKRFWPDCTFALSWFDWANLENSATAREAEQKAAEAQFVILAAGSSKMIPDYVQSWIERAMRRRGDREGVLVGLTGGDTDGGGDTQLYLRKLAHRAGMDYLIRIPQSLPQSVPESVESCHRRATQVTSVLGAILSRVQSPPRLS